MKKEILQGLGLVLLTVSLGASTPVPSTHPTMGAGRARMARSHDDLGSAVRALNAAKMFLAKSTNEAGGHRAKAQQAVENALAELKAGMEPANGK